MFLDLPVVTNFTEEKQIYFDDAEITVSRRTWIQCLHLCELPASYTPNVVGKERNRAMWRYEGKTANNLLVFKVSHVTRVILSALSFKLHFLAWGWSRACLGEENSSEGATHLCLCVFLWQKKMDADAEL